MSLQNFIDRSSPTIGATWLNKIDRFVTTLFGDATTATQARTAISAAQSGVNGDITSLTNISGPIVAASSAGTSGQVLTSSGNTLSPTWQTISSGGGSTPLGGVSLGSITLNHATPNGRIMFTDTSPAGWNTGIGRMTFDSTFVCNSYFAANPNGHVAFVLRQDPALVATAVRGQGAVFGNATGFAQPSDLNPTPMLESWMNGGTPSNFLWSASDGARSAPMQDGVTYRIIVDSSKCNDGNRYLRYRLFQYDATATEWLSLVDTGDVLDNNTVADLTQSAFVIGQVFESNLTTWSISFTNAKITWGPAENAVPDVTSKLSRFGAQLTGDLSFLGNGRAIKFPYTAGPSLTTATAFQSSTANTRTTVVYKPNGSSTIANTMYSNNSVSSTTYGAVLFGINGSVGTLETFGYSQADPVFAVNIGAGNEVVRFTTSGMKVYGATSTIGTGNVYMGAGLFNFLGSNAASFTSSTTLDIDAICAIGAISSFIGGSYNAGNLENILRPLYCMLSTIYGDLKNKKV